MNKGCWGIFVQFCNIRETLILSCFMCKMHLRVAKMLCINITNVIL